TRVDLVEELRLEPVRRAVGVRGAEQLRPGDGHAAQELGEELLGDDGDLVDVGAGDGHASDGLLGLGVRCADDVDGASEDGCGGGTVGVLHGCGEGPEQGFVLHGLDDVAEDRVAGAADHDELAAAGCASHEPVPAQQGHDGLAGPDGAVEDVDGRVGGREEVVLLGGQCGGHASSCGPSAAAIASCAGVSGAEGGASGTRSSSFSSIDFATSDTESVSCLSSASALSVAMPADVM